MTDGAFSSSKKKQRRRVQIPDFLQPLINQATGTASSALRDLSSASDTDLVADFTPEQEEALRIATARAGGAGGFIPTAQNNLLETARGISVSDFLPNEALEGLTGFSRSLSDIVPAEALESLTGFGSSAVTQSPVGRLLRRLSRGDNIGAPTTEGDIRGILDRDFVPGESGAALRRATSASPTGIDEIDRVLEGEIIPAGSRESLEATARGDFLFGGQGFDQAVDAATRAALPRIISTFGGAGAGGATGGLARAAVGQSAIDAFASQFDRERARQLAASGQLADLNLDETGVRLGAQDQRERQALARSGQGIGAAEVLANLGLTDADIRIGAFDDLEDAAFAREATRGQQQLQAGGLLADTFAGERTRELQASGLLADAFGDERNRELEASGLLAGLADNERSRALTATNLLPEAALLDANLLSQVGETRQNQAQREISTPLDFQRILLEAARLGLPIESLLGENIRGRSSGFNLGFSS